MSQMTTEKRERKAMRAERRRRKDEVCELPAAADEALMDDSDSQWTDLEEEELEKGPKKIKKKLAKKIVVISSSVK